MSSDVVHHSQRVATELSLGGGLSGIPFLSKPESAEQWLKYEQLFYSCLITGDDKSASLCLERLEERFGPSNEKIKGLRGVYDEAHTDGSKAEELLKSYVKELDASPTNIPIAKRRITLLKSLGRDNEAITALNKFLEVSPTDIEAWSELAEIYVSLKLHGQALYCFGQVLLLQPNAWNIHARCGEVCLMSIAGEDKRAVADRLLEALQHYSRSTELCEDYVRGTCGLKRTTTHILELEKSSPGLFEGRTLTAAQSLHKQTDLILQEIIKSYPADCELPDILAAKLLVG